MGIKNMTNKTLVTFGIVGYILTVITSAIDAEGNFLAPIWLIIVAGIIYISFHVLTLKRIWKIEFASRLLLFSSVFLVIFNIIQVVASPAYGSLIIILFNITKVIHFIAYFWAICLLWKIGEYANSTKNKINL